MKKNNVTTAAAPGGLLKGAHDHALGRADASQSLGLVVGAPDRVVGYQPKFGGQPWQPRVHGGNSAAAAD